MILLKVLLFLTVFLIPLLKAAGYFGYQQAVTFGYQQAVTFGYEQIKVFVFIFLTSLSGFVWVLKWRFKWTKIRTVSLVFIVVLLVTSLVGTDQWNSFLGKEPYFQGWVVYAYLGVFSMMVASSRIDLKSFALTLVFSSLLVAVLAIRQWVAVDIFNLSIPTYAGRVVSTFGQPNFYAGFLLLTLPFSYLLFKDKSRKLQLLGWGSGLLSLVGILVSFSRSTILLALLLLILGLTGELRFKFKVGLVIFGIVFTSIFLALKFSSGIVGHEVSEPILTKNPDLTKESVEKRAYIWPEAVKVILQKPFTGYGLENIGIAFANYFEVNKHPLFEENLNISPVLISLKELNIDRSHSYTLDLLLFSGILGLLGWLGLIGILFWKLRQNTKYTTIVDKNVLLISLITYLVWVQFQNQSIVHLIYFWLLVGIIDRERD